MEFDREPEFEGDELEMELSQGSFENAEAAMDIAAESPVEGGMDMAGDDSGAGVDASDAVSDGPADSASDHSVEPVVEQVAGATESASESPVPPVNVAASPAAEGPYVQVTAAPQTTPLYSDSEGGLIELEPSVPRDRATFAPSSESSDAPGSPTNDLSDRTQRMLQPTSDGGPPLARPIIIVRLADDQMEWLINEILKRSAKRNEQTCRELVQHLIHQEFWRRDCEERAIFGH